MSAEPIPSMIVHRLKDKRVLVTGASGFLGQRLVRRLLPFCKEVVSFARGTATSMLEELAGSTVVIGDVLSASDVTAAVRDVDVVFHLAGRSGAQASVADPFTDLRVNVEGLLHVLEAIRQRPQTRIVMAGSRLEYGVADSLPVAEDGRLRPTSPYGLHKYFCELELDLYARTYGISYGVARLTNPYGPLPARSNRPYNVVSQMINRALLDETIQIYGDGSQLRDYIYLEDAVDALIHLALASENIVANVGSGIGTSLMDVASLIVDRAGRGRVETVAWPAHLLQVETGDFIADISAMRALGWQPSVELAEGIDRTIAECAA